ncbi:UNVERIFIED_CONTAM: hypothetical protein HDU68_002425 [Siphonaria sp. JEL0065]|nr:hypothetical protein HDU68_002425 [Siphonaria sp. JEL0065]
MHTSFNSVTILLFALLSISVSHGAPITLNAVKGADAVIHVRDPWCYMGWNRRCISYLKRDTATIGDAPATDSPVVAKRDPWCYMGWNRRCISYLKRDVATTGDADTAIPASNSDTAQVVAKRDPWCYMGWNRRCISYLKRDIAAIEPANKIPAISV